MAFLKEEIILLVDFTSVDENDLIPATLRYSVFLRKPREGDWVRLDDREGHSCLGRIERIKGELIKVAPYWETWISETRTPSRLSSSYIEHPTMGVQGSDKEFGTKGVGTKLHLLQAGA